jgi:hypothetical protein
MISCRLIIDLGLKTSLAEYNVPSEDLATIATQVLGSENDPQLSRVVKLLESI